MSLADVARHSRPRAIVSAPITSRLLLTARGIAWSEWPNGWRCFESLLTSLFSSFSGDGDCDVSLREAPLGGPQRCCGSDVHHPVYINPLLQGCFSPQIPGYKASVFERVFGCYDVDRRLLGPPQRPGVALQTQAAGSRLLNVGGLDRPALLRPPTVNSSLGVQYFLFGCYGAPPELPLLSLIGDLVGGLVALADTVLGVDTLEECATACLGTPYFAMSDGKSVS